ncbi:hypothetical protein J2X11_001103 [Aeromicrobium panaciterrae]|uniref:DUF3592 domain-containing protein n=1 Tax=Aeromicrobium panaciterrae TaxID=363861 RepID=A0ABU1UM47_9ACTN|nr:DUF3592 domain-containing protein [Aeromicrobium panaciterrae]MDR7086264.1 hypothetical protein [Aeromicrobium panaciterrae]
MDLLTACLLIVGISMSAAGSYRLITSGRSPRAEGEVTSWSGGTSWLDRYKHASFRFTTADGTTLDVTSPDGSTMSPEVGKKVRVAYDPQMPTNARIDSLMGRGILLIVLGDLILAIAILRIVL